MTPMPLPSTVGIPPMTPLHGMQTAVTPIALGAALAALAVCCAVGVATLRRRATRARRQPASNSAPSRLSAWAKAWIGSPHPT
jgi:hypothetical protein